MTRVIFARVGLFLVALALALGAAKAQTVPLESRERLHALQQREEALLRGRSFYVDLVNNRDNLLFFVQPSPDNEDVVLPVAAPASQVLATLGFYAVLGNIPSEKISRIVQEFRARDEVIRRQIQQQVIVGIDAEIARVRDEAAQLTSQAETPARSAAWGPETQNGVPRDAASGHRVDVCFVWGGQCDKRVADAFCKANGFADARTYSVEGPIELKQDSTIALGTREVCGEKRHPPSGCGALKTVVCESPIGAACLSNGKACSRDGDCCSGNCAASYGDVVARRCR